MKCFDFSTHADFSLLDPNIEWQKEILFFWNEWNDDKDYIIVPTSGSTGNPRPIKLKKEAVRASAKMTCDFFELSKGMTALLCLPVQYIAGKMMLIRAELAQMKLYYEEPKVNVEINQTIDFCPMTPFQCQNSLSSISNIKTLLLGGSKVSEELKSTLQKMNINAFESYGMTETISHIAIKDLNDKNAGFQALNGINIEINSEGNIAINAPHISEEAITTTDIGIQKENGQFEIQGRSDHIINTGGIKISPEVLEDQLHQHLGIKGMFYGEYDDALGERLILVLEGSRSINIADFQRIGFKKHQIPKEIHYTEKLSTTPNGKLNRKETIKKLKK